tara:strand:- start:409 stop:702 length:294 start_codon:yes stop_codon:yes gene_type:complete
MGKQMNDNGSTRSEVLDTAKQLITGDRARQYGSAEDNFGCIASMWTAYTGARINASDVANMMALLKIARLRNGSHEDSSVDGCGYLALAHELTKEVV